MVCQTNGVDFAEEKYVVIHLFKYHTVTDSGHADLSEAMSMEKRYFTSDFSSLS